MVAKHINDFEKVLNLFLGKRGGRLVEYDNL